MFAAGKFTNCYSLRRISSARYLLKVTLSFLSREPGLSPLAWQAVRTMTTSKAQMDELLKYTACDIADTLLVLKVPNAGFLSDLHIRAKGPPRGSGAVTIAPASTVLMVSKNGGDISGLPEANISSDKHWVDLTKPDTIVVMQQPEGQKCAVLSWH